MEKPLIPKCSQDLWFGILISFLFCFVFLSFDYSTFWGVNNGATLLVNKQNHPVGFVKNQTVLSTTHLIPDSCSGRYVYIHDDLPSKFNSDLLNNCKLLTRGTDKPNLCPYFENWGFGPAIENTEGVLANTSWFSTNQFTLEVIFHNKMKQYECLTKNSTLASAIYVPFYAGLDASLHLWDSNLTVRDASARDLNAWLSKRPEWKTMWGRDHFLVGGRISWDFRRQTDEISDWGSKLRFLPESLNMSMLSVEGSSWRNDYAIPYPTNFHPAKDSDVVQWQNRMRKLERPHLFTFVGAPRPDQQNSIRGKIIDQCLASSVGKLVDCSSGGIKCDNPASVTRMFQSSVYCLQPTGDSYTRKSAFDSILAGCIPVFFHPGTAYSQYLWHLPKNHTKYSVFIPVRYVEDLKEGLIEKTLVGISKEKELEMREEVIRLIPKLVYADPMSRLETEDAFDLSVKGILETIENVRKTIREGRDPSISFALDLEYGLPVQVRDTAMAINSTDVIPKSDVNREFFAEEHDRKARAGIDYESSYGKARPSDTILKLQRTAPYYKRNRAHVCSFYIRGECTRGAECPYRHEMPITGELAQQNIKDRYYGVNDPVAMKLLNKAGEMPSLEPPEDESIRTLYVGGLDERITEQDLRDNFYAHGEIESVRMVLQRACAFVTYTTREGAEKAAEELSNKLVIKGLRLKLMWGRPQAPKQDSEGTDEARQQAVAHSGLLPRAVISQQQNQIQDQSAPVQHYYNMPPPPSSHERTFYPSMDPQRMGAVVRSQDGAPSGPTGSGENKSGSERQHYAFQTMAPPQGHYYQQQFYPPPYAGYMPPPPAAYQQQYRPQYHAAVPPQQSLPMNTQYQQHSATPPASTSSAPAVSSSGPSESGPSESGTAPTASSQQ